MQRVTIFSARPRHRFGGEWGKPDTGYRKRELCRRRGGYSEPEEGNAKIQDARQLGPALFAREYQRGFRMGRRRRVLVARIAVGFSMVKRSGLAAWIKDCSGCKVVLGTLEVTRLGASEWRFLDQG